MFKELCVNAVKKKRLLMKPNCGTKVPLLAYTFFFVSTNLGSHFKMCIWISRDKKIAKFTRFRENEAN